MVLKDFVPPVLISLLTRLRTAQYGWSGDFATWEAASSRAKGYDADLIVNKVKDALLKVKSGEAVYERDSVLFNKIEYSYPLLAFMMWVAARNRGSLNILDFGGSLGSTYFQNRKFLEQLPNVNWNIVEQESFVLVGEQLFQSDKLKFYRTIDACYAEQNPSLVLLSSVLQYLEKPFDTLTEIFERRPPYIAVDLMPFRDGSRDRITLQRVNPGIYDASYPCWIISRQNFLEFFSRSYSLMEQFDSPLSILLDGKSVRYEGFLFVLKD